MMEIIRSCRVATFSLAVFLLSVPGLAQSAAVPGERLFDTATVDSCGGEKTDLSTGQRIDDVLCSLRSGALASRANLMEARIVVDGEMLAHTKFSIVPPSMAPGITGAPSSEVPAERNEILGLELLSINLTDLDRFTEMESGGAEVQIEVFLNGDEVWRSSLQMFRETHLAFLEDSSLSLETRPLAGVVQPFEERCDGLCNDDDDWDLCPQDCDPLVCGDSLCNGWESCTSCPQDCGPCAPVCPEVIRTEIRSRNIKYIYRTECHIDALFPWGTHWFSKYVTYLVFSTWEIRRLCNGTLDEVLVNETYLGPHFCFRRRNTLCTNDQSGDPLPRC